MVAAGVASALHKARETVKLKARLVLERDPADQETATADCADPDGSPVPLPDGGCGASFLLCLACENARVRDDHHPRLVLLHQALGNARSALPQLVWDRRWGDPAARLEDLASAPARRTARTLRPGRTGRQPVGGSARHAA
ncbi:hypothetical protein [Streptomyces sp. ME19-01-6]|uniref:hypothetical protein n=1 Tax=Streptomyces sp. ME19-01-6 TaxID=3028686 RepID=UPI0029A223AC|nr:hypothetical protein [Streptomyces sp. ME19-01-6]MDX3227740.1 hypothetical protein [Streptomyces sp. ME19-01-6]